MRIGTGAKNTGGGAISTGGGASDTDEITGITRPSSMSTPRRTLESTAAVSRRPREPWPAHDGAVPARKSRGDERNSVERLIEQYSFWQYLMRISSSSPASPIPVGLSRAVCASAQG